MRQGVHFRSDIACDELHRRIDNDVTIGNVDNLVSEINIHALRWHLMDVRHLVERLPVFIGEQFEHPAVQNGRLAKVAYLIAHQFVGVFLLDHVLPESLVGFPLGGLDELGQDGFEAFEPVAHAVLFQLLCFLQHLLPVLRRAHEGDRGNAAAHIMDNVVEIGLHRFHQRDLRDDAFSNTSRGEVGGDGLGNVALGVFVDLCSETGDEFLPVSILMEQILLGLHHQIHFLGVAHYLVAQFIRMCIHITCKPLTDEQPNHVGREHQRTVLGIGPHDRLEEHVFPLKGIKPFIVRKTLGNPNRFQNPFFSENAI